MAAPPEDTAAPATPTRPPRGLVRETLAVFAATFVATAAVGLLGRFVPFVADNVLAFVAAIFLYGPLWVLGRRDEDLRSFGLTSAGWPRHLLAALLMMLVVFPPFVGGYHLYHGSFLGNAPSFSVWRLARWTPSLEGRPLDLATSDGLHLWAVGDRVALYAGERATPPHRTVTVTTDAPCASAVGPVRDRSCRTPAQSCRPSPQRGCVFTAPDWRTLRLTAEPAAELRLGLRNEPHPTPLDLDRGFSWWWLFVLVQLGLVALPEEVLYRGYVQTRLNAVWKPRWRLLGATIGPSLFVTSALFAVGHLAITPGPFRLLVFFPSLLFGWLRERTGTIVAGVVFHAACNVLLRVIASFYYG